MAVTEIPRRLPYRQGLHDLASAIADFGWPIEDGDPLAGPAPRSEVPDALNRDEPIADEVQMD